MSNEAMKRQLLTFGNYTKDNLEIMTDMEICSAWLRLGPNIILRANKMSPMERVRIIDMIELQRQIDSIRKSLEEDSLDKHITEIRRDLLCALEKQLQELVNVDKN